MHKYDKRNFPVDKVRRYLEPGPIVLVSSAWRGKTNTMTMGWHMVMGFEPSLIGCYIWDENHSFDMVRKSLGRLTHSYQLVEVMVAAVGEGGGRLYLNFAKDWRSDFTISIARKDLSAFAAADVDLNGLTG
jgi:flavin reductase (DIM6/NTAB) family NADH-FMN oxidoreductase RutF